MSAKLIGQGVYGCVYYPNYTCKGKVKKDKYVSKLVRNGKNYVNYEYEIGKIIKKINNYQDNFIIQEKKCNIKTDVFMSIINKNTDCKIGSDTSYSILHSKYIESNTYYNFLKKNKVTTLKQELLFIYDIFNKITLMGNVNIIHMDLHLDNILIDKNNKLYIIDFGVSLNKNKFFIKKKINYKYLINNWFHIDFRYTSYPLEYFFISYIIKHNLLITNKSIKFIITTYYENTDKFIFPDKELYIKMAYNFFIKIPKDKDIFITELLSYSNTWDSYKIGIIIVNLYKHLYDESFKDILRLIIHPNPSKRLTSKSFINQYKNYLD